MASISARFLGCFSASVTVLARGHVSATASYVDRFNRFIRPRVCMYARRPAPAGRSTVCMYWWSMVLVHRLYPSRSDTRILRRRTPGPLVHPWRRKSSPEVCCPVCGAASRGQSEALRLLKAVTSPAASGGDDRTSSSLTSNCLRQASSRPLSLNVSEVFNTAEMSGSRSPR